MRIKGATVLTLSILAISVSCSGPQLHRVEKNNLNALQKPDAETARVVFIRSQKGMAAQGVIAIYDGNDLIGGLSSRSYFTYDAKPGRHIFGCYSSPPNMDFLLADIDGGRTYYAQCSYQDRVLSLASKIIAIKKGSDIMDGLPGKLPTLEHASLTAEGETLYKVHQEEAGRFIIDTRAAMVTYRIDIEGLRGKWLEEAKTVQKPQLLTEDGM